MVELRQTEAQSSQELVYVRIYVFSGHSVSNRSLVFSSSPSIDLVPIDRFPVNVGMGSSISCQFCSDLALVDSISCRFAWI